MRRGSEAATGRGRSRDSSKPQGLVQGALAPAHPVDLRALQVIQYFTRHTGIVQRDDVRGLQWQHRVSSLEFLDDFLRRFAFAR